MVSNVSRSLVQSFQFVLSHLFLCSVLKLEVPAIPGWIKAGIELFIVCSIATGLGCGCFDFICWQSRYNSIVRLRFQTVLPLPSPSLNHLLEYCTQARCIFRTNDNLLILDSCHNFLDPYKIQVQPIPVYFDPAIGDRTSLPILTIWAVKTCHI